MTQRIVLTFSDEQVEVMESVSRITGHTRAGVVRQAVFEYTSRILRENREQNTPEKGSEKP